MSPILSLSIDLGATVMRYVPKAHKMLGPQAVVDEGMNGVLVDRFEIVGPPKSVLGGRNGKIVATEEDLRSQELLRTLEEHRTTTADTTRSTEPN